MRSRNQTVKPLKRGQRRTLTLSDYQTLAQFRYVCRLFARFSEIAARAAGLTAQQHQALLAIRGFSDDGRLSIGELAKRLNLESHSVVGLVNRLVLRGLVRRLRDPTDARRVHVEVRARGNKLLTRLSQVHREELRRVAPLMRRLLANVS